MKLNRILVSFFMIGLFLKAGAQQTETVSLGKVKMQFTLDKNGTPAYEVYYNNKPFILPSRLGFRLNVDSLFYIGLQTTRIERKSFDQTWQTVWGETKDV